MNLDIDAEEVIEFDPLLNEQLDKLRRLNTTLKMIESDAFESIFDCCESEEESNVLRLILSTSIRNEIVYLAADIRKEFYEEIQNH